MNSHYPIGIKTSDSGYFLLGRDKKRGQCFEAHIESTIFLIIYSWFSTTVVSGPIWTNLVPNRNVIFFFKKKFLMAK